MSPSFRRVRAPQELDDRSQIDLSGSKAQKLCGTLDGYISKARKVSGKRSTTRKAS
jgi:hypothetical protein